MQSKKGTKILLVVSFVFIALGIYLFILAEYLDSRYTDMYSDYEKFRDACLRIELREYNNECREAFKMAGFSEDQIKSHMKHNLYSQIVPSCPICPQKDSILKNYYANRQAKSGSDSGGNIITTDQLLKKTKPIHWAPLPFIAGVIFCGFGIIHPIYLIAPWWKMTMLKKQNEFIRWAFKTQKGRLTLVSGFVPFFLLLAIYWITGCDWPDDDVLGSSLIVGPLSVWSTVILYKFIISGEK